MEFERDEKGIVKLCPLTGYAMAPVAGMACLLRMEFLTSPGKAEAIQFVMSPKQATDLSETMLKMVATIDLSVPPGTNKS